MSRTAPITKRFFAREAGAVAAPPPRLLHFDEDLLAQLRARGVEFAEVTLHVGAGTFLPVKTDDVTDHKMHAEWGQVGATAAAQIARARAEGRRVIPVGTTALRVIETAATGPGQIAPYTGMTDIFINTGLSLSESANGLMNQCSIWPNNQNADDVVSGSSMGRTGSSGL